MNSNKNEKSFSDIPLGFGMTLSKNVAAMEAFAKLTEAERQNVINKARTVSSKAEMQSFVNNITSSEFK